MLDVDLITMRTQVGFLVLQCFGALRQLRAVRRYVSAPVIQAMVTSSPVLSRLDYCSSVFHGLTAVHTRRLMSVLDAAAHLVFNLLQLNHVIDAFVWLSALRISERIWFKMAVLAYRSISPHRSVVFGQLPHSFQRIRPPRT
jgi:hypothetical protein